MEPTPTFIMEFEKYRASSFYLKAVAHVHQRQNLILTSFNLVPLLARTSLLLDIHGVQVSASSKTYCNIAFIPSHKKKLELKEHISHAHLA